MATISVSLSPRAAAEVVKKYVTNKGMSVECVSDYRSQSGEGPEVVMLVFEKYYMRNSSRASLSVIFENLKGRTVVCSVGSGGGQGSLFRFDWGAADDFARLVEDALQSYR